MSTEKKLYTLSQLTTSLENFILKHFGMTHYWVVAEIAKINQKGGHYYLELADSENGRTTSQISATIWASAYRGMREQMGEDLKAILQPGNKVLFQMRIEYHKIYGLKLNVLDVDPSFSHGEIERKKQETIEKLKKEGLFHQQKELYLPVLSKRIALIGSPGTSGYRDFMNELLKNKIYRNFKVKEFPASVQGDKAATELIEALKEARQYDVDVIVMVRGGGSKMDLNVFNDYELSKEICLTEVPVVVGIGHETDEVVADLVCRQRCITPTAAAKFLYLQIGVFSGELQKSFDALLNLSLGMLSGSKDEFNHLNKYLLHFSKQLVLESLVELNEESHRLQMRFMDLIHSENAQLDLQLNKIARQAVHRLNMEKESELPNKLELIQRMSVNHLQQKQLELKGLEDLLSMLDPKRLLENGYTISTIDDVDLYEISTNLLGKEMKTLTTHSLITSKITDTQKK